MNSWQIKLLVLFLFSSLNAWSQSKTMLFIDLNNSVKEVKAAKKVAQQNGMELLVYPEKHSNGFNREQMNQDIKNLLANKKVQTVGISGHNGGDSYSGATMQIQIGELLTILKDTGNDLSVESLYLLGCNSANKSKIFFWKSALPHLKFIAGYDGSAPLGTVDAGVRFFEDILRKQDSLLAKTNVNALKQSLENIQNINSAPASIYCDNLGGQLFLSGRKGSERFSKLSTNECAERNKTFKEKYVEKIRQYWAADIEPEMTTSSGFLYEAYVFYRQNEHCFDEQVYNMDGDTLLFLRFNHDFNINALTYYRPLLQDLLTQIEDYEKNQAKVVEEKLKEYEGIYNKMGELLKDPLLNKKINAEVARVNALKAKLLEIPGVKSCLENPVASCKSFERELKLIDQYYENTVYLEELPNRMENYRNNNIYNIQHLRSIAGSDTLDDETKKKLTESKKILSKMILTPEGVTRKELVEAAHKLRYVLPWTDLKSTMTGDALNEVMDMNASTFPFSWHERKANGTVEAPSSRTVEQYRQGKIDLKDADFKFISPYLSNY